MNGQGCLSHSERAVVVVIGFAHLLTYVAHSLLFGLLVFLAGRARAWVVNLLLLVLLLLASVGALHAVLTHEGRMTLPPKTLWCYFQLFVVGTVGGMAFTWGGWRSVFILLYSVCVVILCGFFARCVVARAGLGDSGTVCCVACLYGCFIFLYSYFETCLIPSLVDDGGSRTTEKPSSLDRVRTLRMTLRIVIMLSALCGILATSPWLLIVLNYDNGHFMGHPAGGPGLGALFMLLLLPMLPGAIVFGTLMSYFASRWC